MQGLILIAISIKNQFMRLFLSLFAICLIMIIGFAFSPVKAKGKSFSSDRLPDGKEIYAVQVIQNDTGAWYYQILKDQKVLIIQKSIPAISGNKAFVDSTQAASVGALIVHKLSTGLFPPGVNKHELDSLQIIM